jgi:hypothetical protein
VLSEIVENVVDSSWLGERRRLYILVHQRNLAVVIIPTNGHEEKFAGSNHINNALCVNEYFEHHFLLGSGGGFAFWMSAGMNLDSIAYIRARVFFEFDTYDAIHVKV